jgi:outer membrane protein TolC
MIRVSQVGVLTLFGAGALLAQSYTLRQAVSDALDRYPGTRVPVEQMSAAAAAINLARTSYLPRLDFSGQTNRATRNNVFGMLLPQGGVPGISGPVLGTNGGGSVWGSALGLQVAWEPFDFGLRSASVGLAEAGRRRAETAVARTRFEVAGAAADAFLTVIAAQQTAIAAEAGVRRSKVLLETVEALVRAQLRPGADASRARAELAIAETQLIQAQQAIDVAKASLSRFVGADPAGISTQEGPLLDLPEPGAAPPSAASDHPFLAEQNAAVQELQASRRVLDKSYYPRFNLVGASYARGTGAMTDGRTLGGISGLGPNIHNWGVGLSVSFPILDLPSLNARKEIASHNERAETARYEQTRQDLSAALSRARAELEGARRVARNTPIQRNSALDAERQAAARYKAGLGTLIEVADAQRLVTQAEIDDSLARLNVWRAMLNSRVAEGDLEPFLQQASR